MSRRRSTTGLSQPWVKNTIAVVIVGLIVALVGGLLLKTPLLSGVKDSLPSFSANKEEEEEVKAPENVSTDILARLSEGTALIFGAKPDPSKPVVSIVGDPAALSRSSHIVNGKPSDFMNAVKDKKITFYYYPVGNDDKKVSTDSITRASVCRIGAEKTTSGIFTLTGIVNTGDKVTGEEDVKNVSKMMGMSEDVKCPTKTNEAATQTTTNGEFFAEHFGIGREDNGEVAIVVGDEVITHPESLPANWVHLMLAGKPLREIVMPADKIENPAENNSETTTEATTSVEETTSTTATTTR